MDNILDIPAHFFDMSQDPSKIYQTEALLNPLFKIAPLVAGLHPNGVNVFIAIGIHGTK